MVDTRLIPGYRPNRLNPAHYAVITCWVRRVQSYAFERDQELTKKALVLFSFGAFRNQTGALLWAGRVQKKKICQHI